MLEFVACVIIKLKINNKKKVKENCANILRYTFVNFNLLVTNIILYIFSIVNCLHLKTLFQKTRIISWWYHHYVKCTIHTIWRIILYCICKRNIDSVWKSNSLDLKLCLSFQIIFTVEYSLLINFTNNHHKQTLQWWSSETKYNAFFNWACMVSIFNY